MPVAADMTPAKGKVSEMADAGKVMNTAEMAVRRTGGSDFLVLHDRCHVVRRSPPTHSAATIAKNVGAHHLLKRVTARKVA